MYSFPAFSRHPGLGRDPGGPRCGTIPRHLPRGAAARLHDVDGGGAAHTPLMGFPSAAYLLTDVFFITPFFPSHPNVLDPKVSSVS